MGMVCNLRRLADADLARLFADPDRVPDYLYRSPIEGFGPFVELDIDKAWHGIHFTLTGSEWEGEPPLDFLVRGGKPIGDVPLTYGPAQGLTSTQVRAVADALRPITSAELTAKFDPQAMNGLGIHPGIWGRAGDRSQRWLVHYYDKLYAFCMTASDEGQAMVVWIS
jgi:hypothetical protein